MYYQELETLSTEKPNLKVAIEEVDRYIGELEGSRFAYRYIRRLHVDKDKVDKILSFLVSESVLTERIIYLCPQHGDELEEIDERLYCERCSEYFSVDEANRRKLYLRIKEPMSEKSQGKNIFVSYAHEDDEWLTRFKSMWAVIERAGVLSAWSDRKIRASENWREKIDSAMRAADIAFLLVSDHFFNSDFIWEEELPYILNAAEKRDMKIFWVAITSVPYKYSPLNDNDIQAGNDDPSKPLDLFYARSEAEGNRELNKIIDNLMELIEEDE